MKSFWISNEIKFEGDVGYTSMRTFFEVLFNILLNNKDFFLE